jgi:hypothetical protein
MFTWAVSSTHWWVLLCQRRPRYVPGESKEGRIETSTPKSEQRQHEGYLPGSEAEGLERSLVYGGKREIRKLVAGENFLASRRLSITFGKLHPACNSSFR